MRLSPLPAGLLLLAPCAIAQPQQSTIAPGNGSSVRGTVTAIAVPFFTIKTEEGESWQVKLGPNARLVKGGAEMRDQHHRNRTDGKTGNTETEQEPPQPITVTDIHIGDVIAAGGDLDPAAKKLNAAFAFVIDAATVQKLAADWGVTYIAGKITAIDADNAKLTVQRPDGKRATILADENTSFRKARESITLADIKVGDTITARGAQKNGIFTPATLVVFDPNARRGPRNGAPRPTNPQ